MCGNPFTPLTAAAYDAARKYAELEAWAQLVLSANQPESQPRTMRRRTSTALEYTGPKRRKTDA